jgi:hypothetical protein
MGQDITIDGWIDFYEKLKVSASQNPDSAAKKHLVWVANVCLKELYRLRTASGGEATPAPTWRQQAFSDAPYLGQS